MTRPSKLKEALFADHEAEMIRQAEKIRDWPVGSEREEQAMIHVRQALHETPTRISERTQYRIYSILSFVMPGDSWRVGEEIPQEVLEQEAA